MSARLEIEVLGDVKSLEAALAKSRADLAKFKKQAEANSAAISASNAKAGGSFAMLGGRADKTLGLLKSPGAAFAGGIVASAALDQAKAAIDVASNLNEQASKTSVVFGQSADSIMKWSKTAAQGIGVAQDQALEAAATFGNLVRAMGMGQAESADLSRSMVNLAGDLASFNNANPEDALLALRSAIVGEYEPLRRFGSALSEARVQQQAMIETGKRSAKELSNQDKVTARYHLILKDTALAQGDFARTSDGLANKQRILAAEARNLQGNIGTLLIPAVASLTSGLNDAVESANSLIQAFKDLGNLKMPDFSSLKLPEGLKPSDGGNPFSGKSDPMAKLMEPFYKLGLKLAGVDTSEKTAPMLFSSFSNMSMAGLPGGPGGGGPTGVSRVPGFLANLRGPGSTGTDVLQTQLPLGLQNAIDMARVTGNKGGLMSGLVGAKQFLNGMLGQAQTEEDRAKLLSALQQVQSEIQSVYADRAAEAEQAKAKVREARDKAKAKAKEISGKRVQSVVGALDDLSGTISDAIGNAAGAIKSINEQMTAQAEKFKSDVLSKLDAKQQKLDVGRALVDAQEGLALAKRLGGKYGIREARRNLQDAQIAQERFRVEQASFKPGANGVTVVNMAGAVIKADSVDDFIRQLHRKGRSNAPQSRGKNPGGLYGIPH